MAVHGQVCVAEKAAAGAIVAVARRWASYITGQVLEVNGGSYM
jgi:NAD(P)-dependent dehydrogenase (short-subunit alcohol dehydrogenase family)